MLVLQLVVVASLGARGLAFPAKAVPPGFVRPWEASYAYWRFNSPVSVAEWHDQFAVPAPQAPALMLYQNSTPEQNQKVFYSCLESEAVEFSRRVMLYKPPRLEEVKSLVRKELDEKGMGITIVIFWGRMRYVKILWPYIERNLRVNGGSVDVVVILYLARQPEEATDGNREFLEDIAKKFPTVVDSRPFCVLAFGCAFSEILTDPKQVYIKLDDDIIFIKDGSIEHLAYQTLLNPDYSFYAGSVVNNPQDSAIHKYAGVYPPSSYHWSNESRMGSPDPPFYNRTQTAAWYYGKNMYDTMGSWVHEAFIYNVANNRLDVYGFDLWDNNQCRCGLPQEALNYCNDHGFYRWNVNVFSWIRKPWHDPQVYMVPTFDEIWVSGMWAQWIPPHRSAVVGEALFVHAQFLLQRYSSPDFGLREDVLLPWYTELARQYTSSSTPFGGWSGNRTLFAYYESLQAEADSPPEPREEGWSRWRCQESEWDLERDTCPPPS